MEHDRQATQSHRYERNPLMTEERLQTLKSVTTWGGVVITFSGIALNIANGGSWQGNSLSFGGLFITCCGHLVSGALARHQAAEKAADHERIAELTARVDYAEETLDNPDLKRAIHKEASRYADEHQDDGR